MGLFTTGWVQLGLFTTGYIQLGLFTTGCVQLGLFAAGCVQLGLFITNWLCTCFMKLDLVKKHNTIKSSLNYFVYYLAYLV